MFAKTILGIAAITMFFPSLASAGKWQELSMLDFQGHLLFASSELNAGATPPPGRYSLANLFDQRLDTCWAEGATGDGRGSYIIFDLPLATKTIAIANGYQKSRQLFLANNRPAAFNISILVGINIPGEVTETYTLYHTSQFPWQTTKTLQDKQGFQQISLSPNWQALANFKDQQVQLFRQLKNIKGPLDVRYLLKLRIESIFPGNKYNDTCLSQIKYINSQEKIEKVYVNGQEDSILFDTPSRKGLVLTQAAGSILQIVAQSPNNNWLVVIRMDAAPTPRAETIYELYNTRLRQKINQSILGGEVGDMYDFEIKQGNTYLSFLNNKSQEIEELNLEQILKKLEKLPR